MTSTTVEFQCIIHRSAVLGRNEFLGRSFDNPRCAHDITDSAKLIVTTDQWNHVCSKDQLFVIVGAINSPDGLNTTWGNAGVVFMPCSRRSFPSDTHATVCELFAGGFSGWTHVCRSLTHLGHDIRVIAAIDHDQKCIQAYCKSHHVDCQLEAPHCEWGNEALPSKMAICAKVESHEWCHLLGTEIVHMICISPPCPPWSWASAFEGLNKEEGRLTLHAWGKIAIFGPRVVCMEMVGAMVDHPHWHVITEFIRWTGYTIKWFKVASLREVAPHKRERLILIAISTAHERELAPHRCTMWPSVPPFSLQTYQAVFDLGIPWSIQAFPSDRVLQMYLNPELLPKPMNDHERPLKRSKKDVEAYRIRFPTGIASCIMANYSFAHLLPPNVLQQRGLFGALFMSSKGLRFFALPELVSLFTATNDLWLPSDPQTATRMLGNAIAVPHAALGIVNGLAFLNKDLTQVEVQELILEVLGLRLNSGNMKWNWEDGGVRFFRFEETSDDQTQPMHEFFQIKMSTPTQRFQLFCEPGVKVTEAIQILTGPSNPAQLSMTLGQQHDYKFALPKDFSMPCENISLFAGVPSVIMVDKSFFHGYPDEIRTIVVFTHSGVCLICRSQNMTVAEVAQIVRCKYVGEHVPTLLNIGGEVLAEQAISPICVVGMDRPIKSCDITILSMLQIRVDGNMISFRGAPVALKDWLRVMSESNYHELLSTMGWMIVAPTEMISNTTDFQIHELQMIQKPNNIALMVDDFIMFFMTRLFIGSVQLSTPIHNDSATHGIFLRLKMWETYVWEGVVPQDFQLITWVDCWSNIATSFGVTTQLRLVHKGRQINPDWPCYAIIDCDPNQTVTMVVHCVMSLHGGGPSDISLSQVSISSEDISSSLPGDIDLNALEQTDFSKVLTHMTEQWNNHRSMHIETRFHAIQSIQLQEEDGMIAIQGNVRANLAFLQILQDHGVTQYLDWCGWTPVIQFTECHSPVRTRLIIFPRPGLRVVSSAAIRRFLHACLTVIFLPQPAFGLSASVLTKIKLWGVPVFHAWLPADCPLKVFHDAWDRGCHLTAMFMPSRLICWGNGTNPDFQLQHYAKVNGEGHLCVTLHFVVGLHGGGGNTVRDATVHQSNALATFLLQENCNFQEAAGFVKSIMDIAGHQAIQDILTAKDGNDKWRLLQKLADSLKLSMPDTMTKIANRRKKTQDKFRSASKAVVDDLQPHNFVLSEGFFLNEDGTPCVQQKHLTPNSTGVVIMKGPEAMQWIEKAQTLSQDELGVVVVGPCPCGDKARCKKIQIPAHDVSGFPVVLAGCFHDVGKKPIRIDSKHDTKIPIQDTVIISWTTYRDEVGNESWGKLISAPVKTTLEWALGSDHDLVFSAPPWGRTYHKDRVKVQPQEATSMQFHSRIDRGQLQRVLKASGNAGVYVNVKTETKQISSDYQVIWLNLGPVDLACTAATFPNHCGIVRNNNRTEAKISRGLRFKNDDFKEAFQQLKPGDELPVLITPNFLYKISPIPLGASADHIQQWLTQQKFTAKPLRVLGNQTWLIASSKEITQEFSMWNGNSLLIKRVLGRQSKDPIIVAGTIPKSSGSKESSTGLLKNDPWADYRGVNAMPSQPLPSAVTRKLEGPIETRFQQQEKDIQNVKETTKDIETIKHDIAQLKDAIENQQKRQDQHRQEVSHDFKKIRQETTDQVNALAASFQDSLSNSAAQQERSMMSQFAELKAMLCEKPALQAHKKAKSKPPTEVGDEDMKEL